MCKVCDAFVCRAENRAVLHSVLPKEAIDRIRAEADWYSGIGDDTKFKAMHVGESQQCST